MNPRPSPSLPGEAALGGPGRAALLLVLLLAVTGCGDDQPAGPPEGGMPAPEVAVAVATTGKVAIPLEYTGRAAGSKEVEVRARVSGILLERRYEEGRSVRKGDVLFVIDPEPYRAAVAQVRAELGGRPRAPRAGTAAAGPHRAAVRAECHEPAPAGRGGVGVRDGAGQRRGRARAPAHGRTRPGLHGSARAHRRLDQPRGSLRGQPRRRRCRIEPADANRPDAPGVRRVLGARRRSRTNASRAGAARRRAGREGVARRGGGRRRFGQPVVHRHLGRAGLRDRPRARHLRQRGRPHRAGPVRPGPRRGRDRAGFGLRSAIAGLAAMRVLPIAQYPEIAPPQVIVRASYPGAMPRRCSSRPSPRRWRTRSAASRACST
jgi:hypothetical protein